jgi:uncharacterized protein YjiS (DUF1127 family)
MTHTLSSTHRKTGHARELLGSWKREAISLIVEAIRRLGRARTRRLLRSLDGEQLADAGIERSSIDPRPQLTVDARLMSSLMSLQ